MWFDWKEGGAGGGEIAQGDLSNRTGRRTLNTNRNEELYVASASASWPAIDTDCKEGREDQRTPINLLKSILNFEQDSTGVAGTGSGSGGAAGGSGDLEVAAGAGCSTTSFATADPLEGSALAACPDGSVCPCAIITCEGIFFPRTGMFARNHVTCIDSTLHTIHSNYPYIIVQEYEYHL